MSELKNTKQRAAILLLLKNAEAPLSAEELFERLGNGMARPALSTVYRNLERFAEEGLAERDVFRDGVVRYSLAGDRHGHYLVCTCCAEKIKIGDCPLSHVEQGLAADTGYEIEGHSLTIYGKCPRCLGMKEK